MNKRISTNDLRNSGENSFKGLNGSFKLNIDKARKFADNRHSVSKSVERPHNLNSLNSLNFDYLSIKTLVNQKIRDHEILVPPTKESLGKLFKVLNL